MEHTTLRSILILMGVAVFVVAALRRLHLPAVLAYLVTGYLVGPHGVGLITDSADTRELAEFGVVFLLFTLGLEFSVSRFWVMRKSVFVLGGAQVLFTTLGTVAMARLMGGSTPVAIHTSLNVTGRPAQFGRSLLPEVSGKLIAQFASNLEALIASDNAPAAAEETAAPESAGTAADSSGAAAPAAAPAPAPAIKQEESLNAFKFVVIPVLKRLIPVAAAGAAIAVIIRRLTGKKKSS